MLLVAAALLQLQAAALHSLPAARVHACTSSGMQSCNSRRCMCPGHQQEARTCSPSAAAQTLLHTFHDA